MEDSLAMVVYWKVYRIETNDRSVRQNLRSNLYGFSKLFTSSYLSFPRVTINLSLTNIMWNHLLSTAGKNNVFYSLNQNKYLVNMSQTLPYSIIITRRKPKSKDCLQCSLRNSDTLNSRSVLNMGFVKWLTTKTLLLHSLIREGAIWTKPNQIVASTTMDSEKERGITVLF